LISVRSLNVKHALTQLLYLQEVGFNFFLNVNVGRRQVVQHARLGFEFGAVVRAASFGRLRQQRLVLLDALQEAFAH
jgi:hypothetical protein